MRPSQRLNVLTLLPLLFLTGCETTKRDRDHDALLAAGQASLDKKQYGRVIEDANAILKEGENTPAAASAYYLRGVARAMSNQRAAGYQDLQKAVGLAGEDDEVAWRSYSMIGVMSFEDEKWPAAAAAFASAEARKPDNPPLDFILYRLGQSLERCGRWSDAQAVFRRIVYELPKGNYSDAALRRIETKPDYFAIQCGVFAERRYADKLLAELKSGGLAARIQPEKREGTPHYVVLVGRYASWAEATRNLPGVMRYVPKALIWP